MNIKRQTKHTDNVLVFGYDHYYPGGGVNDLLGSFGSTREAMEFLKMHKKMSNSVAMYRILNTENDPFGYISSEDIEV